MKKILVALMSFMLLFGSVSYANGLAKQDAELLFGTQKIAKVQAVTLDKSEMATTEGEFFGWLRFFIRIGSSYSRANKIKTWGIQWGSNPHYLKKAPRFIRRPAQRIRQWRLPWNSWRTKDPGHYHFWRKK